jgi:hypothetical protein
MAVAIAINFVLNAGVLGTTGERSQDLVPCIYIACPVSHPAFSLRPCVFDDGVIMKHLPSPFVPCVCIPEVLGANTPTWVKRLLDYQPSSGNVGCN